MLNQTSVRPTFRCHACDAMPLQTKPHRALPAMPYHAVPRRTLPDRDPPDQACRISPCVALSHLSMPCLRCLTKPIRAARRLASPAIPYHALLNRTLPDESTPYPAEPDRACDASPHLTRPHPTHPRLRCPTTPGHTPRSRAATGLACDTGPSQSLLNHACLVTLASSQRSHAANTTELFPDPQSDHPSCPHGIRTSLRCPNGNSNLWLR